MYATTLVASGLWLVATVTALPNSVSKRATNSTNFAALNSDLTFLFQNDNNYTNYGNKDGALLISRAQSNSEAIASCKSLGEGLFAFDKPSAASDLHNQFTYLQYKKEDISNEYWVAGSCATYSPLSKQTNAKTNCNKKLPVLCSQGAVFTVYNSTSDLSRTLTVKSQDLTITGTRNSLSFRFLGIPFANPPVGSLRLAYPEAYSGTKQIDATSFKPGCLQAPFLGTQSEDCLYLNVYTPYLPQQSNGNGNQNNKKSNNLRPIMFWIYGGAFISGSAAIPSYDAGQLVSRGDVVVVSVNYRLGSLGWLSIQGDNGQKAVAPGNYGTADVIAGLKWVKQYAAAFGGDASKITVFGESAGAQSIRALLNSKPASGLFQAAVLQSDPLAVPWDTYGITSKRVTPDTLGALNCSSTTGAAALACFRNASASDILNAQKFTSSYVNRTVPTFIEPYLPVIEPVYQPQQFQFAVGNNTVLNKVPLLIGTLDEEGALFIPAFLPNPIPPVPAAYNATLSAIFSPSLANEMIKSNLWPLNQTDNDTVRMNVYEQYTEYSFFCPNQVVLTQAAQKNIFPRIFNYQFKRSYATPGDPAVCSTLNW